MEVGRLLFLSDVEVVLGMNQGLLGSVTHLKHVYFSQITHNTIKIANCMAFLTVELSLKFLAVSEAP